MTIARSAMRVYSPYFICTLLAGHVWATLKEYLPV